MSIETDKQIEMFIKRGVSEHDPRIQGLKRRAAVEQEALEKAKETAQRLTKGQSNAR